MRVLIADDHRLMVEGTKQALEKAGGFKVVGEASNGAQVMPLVRRLQPDLVLLDLRMPQMDGLTCLAKIRKEFPDMKVAILSVSQEPDLIQTALKRGANAYIVKTVDPDDLAAALRQTVEGTVFTTAGVSDEPGERAAKGAGPTERERVIVLAAEATRPCSRCGVRSWIDVEKPTMNHETAKPATMIPPHTTGRLEDAKLASPTAKSAMPKPTRRTSPKRRRARPAVTPPMMA